MFVKHISMKHAGFEISLDVLEGEEPSPVVIKSGPHHSPYRQFISLDYPGFLALRCLLDSFEGLIDEYCDDDILRKLKGLPTISDHDPIPF